MHNVIHLYRKIVWFSKVGKERSNDKRKRDWLEIECRISVRVKGIWANKSKFGKSDADRCNETVKGKDTFTYKSSHVYEARITIPSPSRGILMIRICIDLFLSPFLYFHLDQFLFPFPIDSPFFFSLSLIRLGSPFSPRICELVITRILLARKGDK